MCLKLLFFLFIWRKIHLPTLFAMANHHFMVLHLLSPEPSELSQNPLQKNLVSSNVPFLLEPLLSRKIFFGLLYAKKHFRNPQTLLPILLVSCLHFNTFLQESSILCLKLFTITSACTLTLYFLKSNLLYPILSEGCKFYMPSPWYSLFFWLLAHCIILIHQTNLIACSVSPSSP